MQVTLTLFKTVVVVLLCLKWTAVYGMVYKDRSVLVAVQTDAFNNLSECIFPKSVLLNMTSFPGNKLNYKFRLLRHQNNHVPVYTFKSDGLSRISSVPFAEYQQTQQVYFSDANDATLQLTCVRDKRTFTVTGIIPFRNQEYLVRSTNKADMALLPVLLGSWDNQTVFLQLEKLVRTKKATDYIISEKSIILDNVNPSSGIQLSTSTGSQSGRQRRDAPIGGVISLTSFTVEVLVVVDYSVFKTWYMDKTEESLTNDKVRADIRNYYNHVMKEVDQRYRNIGYSEFQIHIVLAGVIIIEYVAACPWINGSQEYSVESTQNELNADYALKAFKVWINETGGLPTYDHAILFTKYDLYTSNKLEATAESKVSQTSGLAFIGTLCDAEDSVSIVEEQGGFQSVGTVAHEIGHSLGALHDGENNTCRSENRYIMAASGFGPVPETEKYNPWFFSECSIEYFKHFIAKQLTEASTCLLNPNDRVNPVQPLPGQLFNPDKQCKMIWGPESYLCRGAEFGNASSICTAMYCRDPSTLSDCVLHTAARGTSCGNKQWCNKGKCVYSRDAPTKKDGCILGDQPGPAFNGMTCTDLVSLSPSYCYQDKVRARCCDSCGVKHTLRTGCEYGDRIQGCRPWHCTMLDANRDIKSECCATCNTGVLITSTEPQLPEIVTEWIGTFQPVKIGVCEDRDVTSGKSCGGFIQSRGHYVCYDDVISSTCCRSCRSISSPRKECKYGDRTPDLCSRIANRTKLLCSRFESHCCESCVQEEDGISKACSIQDGFHFSNTVIVLLWVCVSVIEWMDSG